MTLTSHFSVLTFGLLPLLMQAHLLKPNVGSRLKHLPRLRYDQPAEYLTPDVVVDQLRRFMGVMQHHDAVTGTEKQHVSDDYVMRLSGSMEGCRGILRAVADNYYFGATSSKQQTQFQSCLHLNVSVCQLTASVAKPLPDVIIAVYNPLGWADLRPWLRIPLIATKSDADAHYAYTLTEYETGEPIPLQVVPLPTAVEQMKERKFLEDDKGHSELVFRPEMGLVPAGYTLFALKAEFTSGYGCVTFDVMQSFIGMFTIHWCGGVLVVES